MSKKNTGKLISTIFATKRLLMDQVKKAGALDPFLFLQMEILYFISTTEKPKMKQVSSFLFIKPPSATPIIENMVKKGLVDRVADTKDRRSIYLDITKKGEKALKKHQKDMDRLMTKILSPLTNKDQTQLINIYSKLQNNYKK